jgi:molecular chaperone GrpE
LKKNKGVPEEEPEAAPDGAAETEAPAQPETVESPPEPDAEELLAAERDKTLRLAAEYDNFRKRSRAERESLYAEVRAETTAKFLPVYDNLARAIKTGCSDEAFLKGVEMTMTQLNEALASLGVEEIASVGERFDPARHNAVSHIENAELGEQVIAEEFQKGFAISGKVIRHSIVVVAN